MSLILDALRRADAERGRGAVPGLHTPQAAAVLETPESRPRWPLVGAAALFGGMVVAGGVGWWVWGPMAATAPVATGVSAVPALAPAAPVATMPQADSVAAPVMAAAPAQSSKPAPAPEPASDAPPTTVESLRIEPLPVRPVVPAAPVVTPSAPAVKPPVSAPVPASASAPGAAATAAAAAAKVPLLQELSPAVRQQLPPLAVSGASYSADPSYRMVIVNGQVLREGETAAPGIVLESIAAKQVVMRGHGQRWAVPY